MIIQGESSQTGDNVVRREKSDQQRQSTAGGVMGEEAECMPVGMSGNLPVGESVPCTGTEDLGPVTGSRDADTAKYIDVSDEIVHGSPRWSTSYDWQSDLAAESSTEAVLGSLRSPEPDNDKCYEKDHDNDNDGGMAKSGDSIETAGMAPGEPVKRQKISSLSGDSGSESLGAPNIPGRSKACEPYHSYPGDARQVHAKKARQPAIPRAFECDELESALACRRLSFDSLPSRPVKIAEASFSEVFRVGSDICKIIPFNRHYSKEYFHKEVAIMSALRRERGACNLREYCIICGEYTGAYLDAWHRYDKKTENEDPSIYTADQEYGCIILEDCGVDLEAYKFDTSDQIFLFFIDFIWILFRLEQKYKFEHRDLHWGNIMISGGRVKLIDFLFSRLEVDAQTLQRNILDCKETPDDAVHPATSQHDDPWPGNMMILYTDLSQEEWIFDGDEAVDPQFVVYKEMRRITHGEWESFHSGTNGLWISYIIQKLRCKATEMEQPEEEARTCRLLNRIQERYESLGWGTAFCDWLAQYKAIHF